MACASTLDKTSKSLDSMQLVRKHLLFEEKEWKRKTLDKNLQNNYDSIILKGSFVKMGIVWYTLLGGVGKKNYHVYDPTQQFSSQIINDHLVTFNAGFAVNYIHVDRLKKRTWFFNASVSYLRDNNLASLSTTEIDQSKKSANSGGDTTRMITSKFNVYTDPVVSFMATNVSTNLYYIFGKTPAGFHFATSSNFQDNGLNLSNLTFGAILAFKNAAKDQPVVNTELYLTFKDIGNQQHLQQGFYRRNEVGLSFTIPFNVFF